jgi:hypothetical protein
MNIDETINLLISQVQDTITTNGNNEIAAVAHRGTLISILEQLRLILNQPSTYVLDQFPPYDPLTTYEGSVGVVVQFNSQLWLFVDEIDKTGITPGTLVTAWAPFSMLELAHAQNTDKKLAEFTSNEVSAAEIRALLDISIGGTALVRKDGTTPFTGPQAGVLPTAPAHLVTRAYADNLIRPIWENLPGFTDTGQFKDVAYGQGVWVAVENNSDQVYRSLDDGDTWASAPIGVVLFPSKIDYGNGTFILTSPGGGIYRSVDNGLSWSGVVNGGAYSAISYCGGSNWVAIDGANKSIAYSDDNGLTWVVRATMTNLVPCVGIASDGSRVVALFQSGLNRIVYSDDFGFTWNNATGFTDGTFTSISYGGSAWLVGASSPGSEPELRRSVDGAAWVDLSAGPGNGIDFLAYGNNTFKATLNNSTEVLYSTDRGITWFTEVGLINSLGTVSIKYGSGVWLTIKGQTGIKATRIRQAIIIEGPPGVKGADGLTTSINNIQQVAGDVPLTLDDIPNGIIYVKYTAALVRSLGRDSGAVFPSTPNDRQFFYRTDVGLTFYYDAAREKWLSELKKSAFFQSNTTLGSPTIDNVLNNGLTNRVYLAGADWVLTGIEVANQSPTFVGSVNLSDNIGAVGTVFSFPVVVDDLGSKNSFLIDQIIASPEYLLCTVDVSSGGCQRAHVTLYFQMTLI